MRLRHRHRKAARLARKHGFAQILARHVAMFYPRSDTLIVGFDNMKSRETPAPAYPWGYTAIARAGYSHLGIMMTRRNDWFRHADLDQFFDDLAAQGFFAQFSRVVFFGASMGGYGALTSVRACPGADVVAFAPQTSLDPVVVPFETRYRAGFGRGDWSSPYADAADMAQVANRVVVFADPHHMRDAAHVARLPTHNLRWMQCPNFGHNPARVLKHMGVLGPVLHHAWDGTLTPQAYLRTWRKNRMSAQGLARSILLRGLETGHPNLVLAAATSLQKKHPRWAFPRIIARAETELRVQHRVAA